MTAGRPPDSLVDYLNLLREPALIVDRTFSREIRHWQDGQMVWQNQAAVNAPELSAEDLAIVNQLIQGLIDHESVGSVRVERWEATLAAPASSFVVLRRLPVPSPNLPFEPPIKASLSKSQEAISLAALPNGRSMIEKLAEEDEAAKLILGHRWEDTSLGPMSQWDPCITSAVYTLLTYPWPCCICLGPSHILLYNTQYSRILGKFLFSLTLFWFSPISFIFLRRVEASRLRWTTSQTSMAGIMGVSAILLKKYQ